MVVNSSMVRRSCLCRSKGWLAESDEEDAAGGDIREDGFSQSLSSSAATAFLLEEENLFLDCV